MAEYTPTTNFTEKDTLEPGNVEKIILGADFQTEFNAIQEAILSKANIAAPALTGSASAVNLNVTGDFALSGTTVTATATEINLLSGLTSVGADVTYNEYTAAGAATWNKPANARWVYVECIGGGGGGNSTATTGVQNASGGGGGEFIGRLIEASTAAATETVTVGAGGAGGAAPTGSASSGSPSSLGTLVVAAGGKGSTSFSATTLYTLHPSEGAGTDTVSYSYTETSGQGSNMPGGNTIYGGAGGSGTRLSDSSSTAWPGTTSVLGGDGGGAGVSADPGEDGTAPGGGGGGQKGTAGGGDGATGRVRIWAW